MTSLSEVLPRGWCGSGSNQEPRPVFTLDPLEDARWGQFLDRHPHSSVFHSSAWLNALRNTYGYEPIAFTTSPPNGELRNAALFCLVNSWLTGRRLVSVPFADHCDLLSDGERDFYDVSAALSGELNRRRLRYVQIRPLRWPAALDHAAPLDATYCWHRIDLRQSDAAVVNNLHESSIRRKIRRADREGLTYLDGASEFLLESFHRLWLITRRRHGAPPQPSAWFRNLIESFRHGLKIRVAFKDRQPVAAILTLRHKDTMVYKYGCSDARFHRFGGMQALFWRAISEAKQEGLRTFDLGRSDRANRGLITFKDRWGAQRTGLTYMQLTRSANSTWQPVKAPEDFMARLAPRVFRKLPISAFQSLGSAIYRHLG